MGTAMKLPPRFKIFHNVSEDYYFIEERFCFFWYIREQANRELQRFVWQKLSMTLENLPPYLYKYSSLEEAESKIKLILEYENKFLTHKNPDEIKLVKEYD
jgi:hypothetical protein